MLARKMELIPGKNQSVCGSYFILTPGRNEQKQQRFFHVLFMYNPKRYLKIVGFCPEHSECDQNL